MMNHVRLRLSPISSKITASPPLALQAARVRRQNPYHAVRWTSGRIFLTLKVKATRVHIARIATYKALVSWLGTYYVSGTGDRRVHDYAEPQCPLAACSLSPIQLRSRSNEGMSCNMQHLELPFSGSLSRLHRVSLAAESPT
eukprot:6203253-Pleurochrysis_carterae.AAC.3